MKAYFFKGDKGSRLEESEIPEDYKQKAENLRNKLLESLADEDEEIMESLLEEKPID